MESSLFASIASHAKQLASSSPALFAGWTDNGKRSDLPPGSAAKASESSSPEDSSGNDPNASSVPVPMPLEEQFAAFFDLRGGNKKRLDVTVVAPHLLIAAPPQPSLLNPTHEDPGRGFAPKISAENGADPEQAPPPPPLSFSSSKATTSPAPTRTTLNCPLALSEFVSQRSQRFREQALLIQLCLDEGQDDETPTTIPDDRTKTLLERQIAVLRPPPPPSPLPVGSGAPAIANGTRSGPPPSPLPVPSYEHVLQLCYVLSAWLAHGQQPNRGRRQPRPAQAKENGKGIAVPDEAEDEGVWFPTAILYCTNQSTLADSQRRSNTPLIQRYDSDQHDAAIHEGDGDTCRTRDLKNGKSTCALALACWLRYSDQVPSSRQGLEIVMGRMLGELGDAGEPAIGPAERRGEPPLRYGPPDPDFCYWDAVPPSVRRYLTNFDSLVERDGLYPNRHPLLLRAVAVQGLPVDRPPVVEIWSHRHHCPQASSPSPSPLGLLYTSKTVRTSGGFQWAEEEGFFELQSVILDGEWSVVIKFDVDDENEDDVGTTQQQENGDLCESCDAALSSSSPSSSRVILRYVGHTGFLHPGIHELDAGQVDVMRQYEGVLLDEGSDFLLSIVLEAYWSIQPDSDIAKDQHLMDQLSLRRCHEENASQSGSKIYRGARARDCGWQLIAKNHVAQPTLDDVKSFRLATGLIYDDGRGPPDHIVELALQLSNYDVPSTESWLMNRFYSWWAPGTVPPLPVVTSTPEHGVPLLPPPMSSERKHQAMLDILNSADVLSKIPKSDLARGDLLQVDLSKQVPSSSVSAPRPINRDRPAYLSGLTAPHPGDVYSTLRKTRDPFATFPARSSPITMNSTPMFPFHRPTPSARANNKLDDPRHAAAVATLMRIQHAGITLDDLLDLSEAMKTWTPEHEAESVAVTAPLSERDDNDTSVIVREDRQVESLESSAAFTPKELQTVPLIVLGRERTDDSHRIEGEGTSVSRVRLNDQGECELPLRTDPKFEKYFRMLCKGLPDGAVRNALQRDGLDPKILELDPDKSFASQSVDHSDNASRQETPLKEDPKYEKYFRMLAKGLPEGAVRNALQRDGLDPGILDLDPNKNLDTQTQKPFVQISERGSAPSLKNDPRFEKYFRMLAKGLPKAAVRNALQRDALDPGILDLDPNQSLDSQAQQPVDQSAQSSGSPTLKDDPRFEKYFRMLAKGLADGAVRNALARDGLDPGILDLDPNKSLEAQTHSQSSANSHTASCTPALKDDPRFEKYFRMLEKGLPEGAVRNALQRDGLDPSVLDLDREKQFNPTEKRSDNDAPLNCDPRYKKYFLMLAKGLPDGAVRNAMQRDGLDPSVLELDPEKSLSSQTESNKACVTEASIKKDPAYEKYFRMLDKRLPIGAVRNAMQRDGLDPSILDLDRDKTLPSQTKPLLAPPLQDTGIPLREDPDWKKYFTMLKMGLPLGAVRNAVTRDGKDASVMDLDPNKSLEFQLQSSGKKLPTSAKKKKRVRRKKIYWTPIDPGQVKEDSLWSIVRGKVQMSRLKYDIQEFEDLFTESADPGDSKRKKAESAAKKVKKSVQVIDSKRSMNGGIILLRLKMDYKAIAKMVDEMEVGKLDGTQLQSLKENLPTADERKGLLEYMNRCGESEEEKRAAYVQLSECEKYMLAMIEVENAAKKFDCMHYRVQFQTRLAELVESIRVVETACTEVKNSEKLREIMAMILTLVNEINTGGDGKMAVGFSLDALLKLNDAKAFDRKTSVLQYLVRLIISNDTQLLDFRKDLLHVSSAENIILDSLISDIKALEDELSSVYETAKEQADLYEAQGRVQPFSIQELKEQKTAVRNIENIPQYNQVQHITGRTSMERFTANAGRAIKEAVDLACRVKDSYAKLLEYMCESDSLASNDFFGTMRRFANEFDKAREQVEKEEKAKKREKARAGSIRGSPDQWRPSPPKILGAEGATAKVDAERQSGKVSRRELGAEVNNPELNGPAAQAQNVCDPAQTRELESANATLPSPPSAYRGRTMSRENVSSVVPRVDSPDEIVASTLHFRQPRDEDADGEKREQSSAGDESDSPGQPLHGRNDASSGTSDATEMNLAAILEPADRVWHDGNVPLDSLPPDELSRDRGMSIPTTGLASTGSSILPTPGSIAIMAATAAAERMAASAPEEGTSVGVSDAAQSLSETFSKFPTEPDSPRRSQSSSSPPSSPGRIASLIAAKLFGWHQAEEAVEEVVEVDL